MIAIVNYEGGNLTSVQRAVRFLGYESEITQDPELVLKAERVIFPGVGAAGASMENLHRLGLGQALKQAAANGTPLLGICVGTQIIFNHSEEDGGIECLGLLPGQVKRFPEDMLEGEDRLKVPHMGWNSVRISSDRGLNHPVLKDLKPDQEFYFVHSYYPVPEDENTALGYTTYGCTFSSVVGRDNVIAAQFHLEKSGRPGLNILNNFCKWDGKNA